MKRKEARFFNSNISACVFLFGQMNTFKNSDNLEFLNTHAGLGEEICFFSSQKNTYNVCNCFNQLQLSITVRSQDCHEFCFRWSMKIRSNYEQPKQGLLGGWEITRKQFPTSPFHLWLEKKVFFGWFDFIFLFSGLTSLPASLLSSNHAAFLHHLASQHLHKSSSS